jgi:hypothetical protein
MEQKLYLDQQLTNLNQKVNKLELYDFLLFLLLNLLFPEVLVIHLIEVTVFLKFLSNLEVHIDFMNIIVLLGIFYDEFLVKVLLKIEEAP